ncbi:MAG: transcriptional regulator [Candidatus Brockarchaeota archaeon]|nr:transcriptional regulator [Candidatus Brockarchaeota archaeon]
MRPPCESVVQYVLPAFRCLVAKELVARHRFTQVEAAERLGTTQAAISQYFSSKRGGKRMKAVQSTPKVKLAARKLAKEIASRRASADDSMVQFCELCLLLRKRGLVCDLHKEKAAEQGCDLCHHA